MGANNQTGHVQSWYAATANNPACYPELSGTHEADVCVIGGGFTGLSAALHLAGKNVKVILLEAERIGWGASGRNGGQASIGQRQDQFYLEKKLGVNMARRLWDDAVESVQLIRSLSERYNIDCDLKNGSMVVTSKAAHVGYLEETAAHMLDNYDYPLQFMTQEETRECIGSERFLAGLANPQSAHLHPLNYAAGLARAAVDHGVQVFEQSRVDSYSDGSPVVIKTATGSVRARHVVLGCNGYLGRLEPRIAGRIMPINNFVLVTEPLAEKLAQELICNDYCVHDTLFVVNYWRLTADRRLLFGGGENYTMRFPADIRSFVRKYMLRVYPQLEGVKIDYAWGGTLAVTMNRLPSLGRLGPNIYYAQGYSGHGVPIATLSGKILADAICGETERFDLYAGLRIPEFPGGTLLRWPGLVAGMLWHSMLDKIT